MHRAATEAFHRYRPTAVVAPRLYYVALPPAVAAQFALHLHPSEMTLSVCMDIAEVKPIKLQGLRTYRSQPDAQELAVLFASDQFSHEWFYQAYPVLSPRRRPHADFGRNAMDGAHPLRRGLKLEKRSWSVSEGDFAIKAYFRRS